MESEVLESPLKKPKLEEADKGGVASDREDGYDSSDDYPSIEHRDQFRRYRRQLRESEGFDVDPPGLPVMSGVLPIFLEEHDHYLVRGVQRCTKFAIEKHNRDEDINLELVEIIKATYHPCNGIMYFITFEAKNLDTAEKKIYQTKVYHDWGPDDYNYMEIQIFRPKSVKPTN